MEDRHGIDGPDEEEVWLLPHALDLLVEQGPLSVEDLAERLGAVGDALEEIEGQPLVTQLADKRLASVTALLADTVLTHRLSADEAATGQLALGVDIAPLMALVCCDDHVHLPDDEVATFDGWLEEDASKPVLSGGTLVEGPPDWLGDVGEGALVGFRLIAMPSDSRGESGGLALLEVVPTTTHDPIPDSLSGQLRISFDSFSDGEGMPVPVAALLYQLAFDAPALVRGTLAPLDDLLRAAGFEVVDGYAAPPGTDWDSFRRLAKVIRTAALRGLDEQESTALALVAELYVLFESAEAKRVDRDVARSIGDVLSDPEMGAAFAHAMSDAPETTMDFLVKARAGAGRRYTAGLAWVESLVASRCGALARAEACLAEGLSADPDHPELLEDLAWYASDRGDARRALQYLDRIEGDDPDPGRTATLRRYCAPANSGPPRGRNDPCGCGSGRKFKHCCVGRPPKHPLPERVRWLWEKLRWWLEQVGPQEQVLYATLALQGAAFDEQAGVDEGLLVDLDIAGSLVLFEDGAIGDFIAQRAELLPDDEAELLELWASTTGGLYEVVGIRPGEGISLCSQRTGETIEVTEAKGSSVLAAGQVLFSHPVCDGVGHQLVGGVVPVSGAMRAALTEMLATGTHSRALATLIGYSRYLL